MKKDAQKKLKSGRRHPVSRWRMLLTKRNARPQLMEPNPDTLPTEIEQNKAPQVLSVGQFRNTVTRIDPGTVLKEGWTVRPNEEQAMKLVAQRIPNFPVPKVYGISFQIRPGRGVRGNLLMEYIEGKTLRSVWPSLNEREKEKVCRDTWTLIRKLRQIPRPESLNPGAFYTSIDGSPIRHMLLGDLDDECPVLNSDRALRNRVFHCFKTNHGLKFADGKDLPKMLPRSKRSIFTHGDINTENILVNEALCIVGLIDMESAGFLPDYWEYAMMMRPMGKGEVEWQEYMTATKPWVANWDIRGLEKARRVLPY